MSDAVPFFPTTDLSDAYPDMVRQVTLPFQDYGGTRTFSGRIRTAVMVEDSKLIQDVLFQTSGNGDVIVVDAGGSVRTAMLGDRMAERLISNGWSGIVINGAVRDSGRLALLPLGVKALGTTPARSGKAGTGALDVPVAFGSVLFETGKCIYCDDDGILVADEPLKI
ncbi:MAG: ribonuclease E activity regulator RraA [Pseudomonadota bacterium]